jgi:hypothetical protein
MHRQFRGIFKVQGRIRYDALELYLKVYIEINKGLEWTEVIKNIGQGYGIKMSEINIRREFYRYYKYAKQ